MRRRPATSWFLMASAVAGVFAALVVTGIVLSLSNHGLIGAVLVLLGVLVAGAWQFAGRAGKVSQLATRVSGDRESRVRRLDETDLAPPPAGASGSVYYSRPTRRIARGTFAFSLLFEVAVVVGTWIASPLAGVIMLAVFVLATVWLGRALLQAGVYVHDDYFLVRTSFARAINIPWSDIDDFKVGKWSGLANYPVVFARLRSGKEVRLDATCSTMLDPDMADRTIEPLKADLLAHHPRGQQP